MIRPRLIAVFVCISSFLATFGLCIEAVTASTPADCGQVRLQGYELAADFDDDCYVNFKDVIGFAADWLECIDPEQANCEHAVPAGSPVSSSADPLFFDWIIRGTDNAFPDFIPTPHPGSDWPAGHTVYHTLFDEVYARGQPLSLMLTESTGPVHGPVDPDALQTVMSYVPRLDFVFADFEDPDHRDDNVILMVQQVRAHPNSLINSAYIGNYAQKPGVYDESQHYPWITDRTEEDEAYRTSGLNIAQPSCYPYEYLREHTSSYLWGEFVAPNNRSALFWAPLERLSVAKRNLPAGHLLIPWVDAFVPWEGYEADPPEVEDLRALIQHFRLRGSDGFSSLGGGWSDNIPDYNPAYYRDDIRQAWYSLDWLFGGEGETTILNLDTEKVSGLQWSGGKHGPKVAIIISNLGNASARVDYPDIPELPDFSPWIDAGEHLFLTYGTPVNCEDIEPMGYSLAFDLNKDCHIDLRDFGLLGLQWLECVEPSDANCLAPWLDETVYWCKPSTWPSGNRWPGSLSDYNSVIDCNINVGQVDGPYGHRLDMLSGDISFGDWDWGGAGGVPRITNICGSSRFSMGGARFADDGGALLNIGCAGGEPNVIFSDLVRWADSAVTNEIHVCGGSVVFGGGLYFGDDGGGIFEVSGGQVIVDANLDFRCRSVHPDVFGELNVSGGEMLIAGELSGGQNRPMSVTLSGGLLTASSVLLPRENGPAMVLVWDGSFEVDGTFELGNNASMIVYGGTVSVGSLLLDSSSQIDVCGGTLIIDGCVDVSGYIAQGLLTGCGSSQNLSIRCEGGKTIITYQD